MEGRVIGVLIVTIVLGLTAAVMAFAAEGTRIKTKQVGYFDDGSCYYPSSPSFGLGIVAAIILLVEQIAVSAASGCFCCRGSACPSSGRGICGLVCFVFSWLVFIGAFILLIHSAIVNDAKALARSFTVKDSCPIASSGLFLGAGVMCIVSVALGLIAYIALLSNDKKSIPKAGEQRFANEHGVAIGVPQMQTKGQF